MAGRLRSIAFLCVLVLVAGACSEDASPAASEAPAWTEREIAFPFDAETLHGVLTVPGDGAPHAAIVLVAGSGDESGVRDNTSTRWFIDHARRLATEGYAALRYDPPGVGRSTGDIGLPSLERRVEETAAALDAARSSEEIDAGRVGLLGVSQGPWVIAMTATRHADDVAFIISIVGSGQSVAEQQVYGVRAQSTAAGLASEDITKAVVFARLLVDWQLSEPMFWDENRADVDALPDGPWDDMMALVYGTGDTVQRLWSGLDILRSIQGEAWAEALYLRELYLPRFETIPDDITAEQLAALQRQTEDNLLTDPSEFWTEVRVPVLAVFGENDLNVDSVRSAELYRQYLTEAENQDFTIEILPGVGHGITLDTPGYWDTLSTWLQDRFSG